MRFRLALALTVLAALVLATCQGGVLVDEGNAFPCDFSQPEGVRDAVCATGDVCGVDNVCREFHYEGPQFEASATGAPLPAFDSGIQLHPGVLSQPILAVTHRGDRGHTGLDKGTLLMGTDDDAQLVSVMLGPDTSINERPFDAGVELLSSLAQPGDWVATVVLGLTGIVDPLPSGGVQLGVVHTGPLMPVLSGQRLRTGSDTAVLLRGDPLVSSAGEFDSSGLYLPLDIDGGDLDGGWFHPLEARYVPLSTGAVQDLLMLGDDGFVLRRDQARLVRVTQSDLALPAFQRGAPPTLRHDVTGAIWAFTRPTVPDLGWHTLSTWRLDRSGAASMARLWNDCSPCKAGRIVAFTPLLNGAPEVQVLCATRVSHLPGQDETLSLTRVIGSAAIDETEECLVEPAPAPFSLAQLNFVPRGVALDAGLTDAVQDDANGGGILLGGKQGQVWTGDSLTDALPLFLERTPVAFGTFNGPDGGIVSAALTDRYLAVPRIDGLGFQTVDIHKTTDVALAQDVVVAAMMGQAPGWGVLSSADLGFIGPAPDGGHLSLSFGPRLSDARGAAALSPFFAEAVTDNTPAQQPVSFVMTANDSLYFDTSPTDLSDTQDVLPELTPMLTPAPGSPIRSMALERSALGTDGISKVRGYLIAGRQLFIFTLQGLPPRWSATPIVLQGGEPVEVWMDNPLGGLGRVGYRDGEIFTLPGGFLLVNELPRGDGGTAPQVLDYENLGGWPVAMTGNGLFCAQWPKEGVHLQNRFPDGGEGKAMDWSEVTLADGGRPWLGKNARLQVVRTGPTGAHVFHLLVFTDDEVLEVGTLSRK